MVGVVSTSLSCAPGYRGLGGGGLGGGGDGEGGEVGGGDGGGEGGGGLGGGRLGGGGLGGEGGGDGRHGTLRDAAYIGKFSRRCRPRTFVKLIEKSGPGIPYHFGRPAL